VKTKSKNNKNYSSKIKLKSLEIEDNIHNFSFNIYLAIKPSDVEGIDYIIAVFLPFTLTAAHVWSCQKITLKYLYASVSKGLFIHTLRYPNLFPVAQIDKESFNNLPKDKKLYVPFSVGSFMGDAYDEFKKTVDEIFKQVGISVNK